MIKSPGLARSTRMLGSQQIQIIGATIRSVLVQCDVSYGVTPFDHELYQECLDEAVRRGYPVDHDPSVRTYLREGVLYAVTACGHHRTHRSTLIWIALWASLLFFVDDAGFRFRSEIPNLYQFNKRFVGNHQQGSAVLDALADVLNRTSDLFPPLPASLITTSNMNFVTANLLEYETMAMQISCTAEGYLTYQRMLTGAAEACAYMVFPCETPLVDYVQAIPDIMQFINDINDVFSFYKEELAGEADNQISSQAARNGESHLEAFIRVAESIRGLYRRILKTLEDSPVACETFKRYAAGVIGFHISSGRYKLEDLDL